jgi:hypothetical protein
MDESTGTYPDPDWPDSWQTYFNGNIAYIRESVRQNQTSDPYWRQIGLILQQFDGLLNGTNARLPPEQQLRELDLWILQSSGDLDDLAEALGHPPGVPRRDPEFTLRCTALLRVTPGNQSLYFSQDTWSDVRDLHAYLKSYDLRVPEFASPRVSVSARTGQIASSDDFWTNGAGLLILETTMHNFNPGLYATYVTGHPDRVLCWMRAILATFTTTTGREWTDKFIQYNSGTYNNEYIVVDTKVWHPGQPLNDDLVWIVEQLPGNNHTQSATAELANKTYLEGINTPRYQDIWHLANYTGEQQAQPWKAAFWSFDGQIREHLIVRDAPNIGDYEAFKAFMQYNDYLHDDLMIINTTGEREPAQGILARYDLRPPNGTVWGAKNHFAGLDSKTVDVGRWTNDHAWDARLSPTFNETRGVPPFSFDDWPNISHTGIATNWTFPWIVFAPGDRCAIVAKPKDEDNCTAIEGCGFCIPTQTCMAGNKDGPDAYFGYVCKPVAGWKFKTPLPDWAVPVIVSISVVVVIFIGIVIGLAVYGRIRQRSGFQPF